MHQNNGNDVCASPYIPINERKVKAISISEFFVLNFRPLKNDLMNTSVLLMVRNILETYSKYQILSIVY